MTLAEKIVWCRRRAGLSQEELAEKVGVSRQAVSKWELGDATPEVGKLLALARTFGVTTDWLLSEDGPAADAPPADRGGTSSWVDAVPGAIGRLLRQYGWLFGVYLAIGGGLIAALGLVGRHMFRTFITNPFGPTPSNPGVTLCTFAAAVGAVMLIAGVVIALTLYRKRR